MDKKVTQARRTTNPAALSPSDQVREDAFLKARRSVRLWPVKPINGSLEQGVKAFCTDVLKILPEDWQHIRFRSTTAAVPMRRSQVTDEVICECDSSEQRDLIQSHARNLADYDGKAGVRMEVPDFLRGVFRLLQSHFLVLRKKHGHETKKAIKFSDEDRSLYMDIKLPASDTWHSVTAEHAREARKHRERSELLAVRGLYGASSHSASSGREENNNSTGDEQSWIQGRFEKRRPRFGQERGANALPGGAEASSNDDLSEY